MVPRDVLILSNGPGEITTWVKPVVRALRQRHSDPAALRISVVLSPCPNATGQEAAIAQGYPEVNRVQGADHFWPFLLWGKTAANWDWRDRGVVVFLGGDQIYPILIGRRLNYRTVIYAEWFANWRRWADAFGAMNGKLVDQAPPALRHKFTVVGDLMADTAADPVTPPQGQSATSKTPANRTSARAPKQSDIPGEPDQPVSAQPHPPVPSAANPQPPLPLPRSPDTVLIGLLPGSKRAKLTQGVPLLLATADYVRQRYPQVQFVIPVAPTLTPAAIAPYADPQQNPMVAVFQAPSTTLEPAGDQAPLPYLKTEQGTQIFLWQPFPAHGITRQCALCLTTVGANTAELGALGIPMVVLLPTQQLDAMNAWDGILGLAVNLPGIGKPLNRLVNGIFLSYVQRRGKRFAWPNLWAGREVVPELLGPITPQQVGDRVLAYLNEPDRLQAMAADLRQVRGPGGAADKLADLILRTLSSA